MMPANEIAVTLEKSGVTGIFCDKFDGLHCVCDGHRIWTIDCNIEECESMEQALRTISQERRWLEANWLKEAEELCSLNLDSEANEALDNVFGKWKSDGVSIETAFEEVCGKYEKLGEPALFDGTLSARHRAVARLYDAMGYICEAYLKIRQADEALKERNEDKER